jgi:hypothetical protein
MLVADGEHRLLERAPFDFREKCRNFLKGGQGSVSPDLGSSHYRGRVPTCHCAVQWA